MSEENLKLCPFCGAKAIFVEYFHDDNILRCIYAECYECEARSGIGTTEKEVAELWNERWLPEDYYLVKIPKEVIKEMNEPIQE